MISSSPRCNIARVAMVILMGAATSITLPVYARKYSVPKPADIQTLRGVKSGSSVQLNWTDGVSPFNILRSNQPSFDSSPSLSVLATAQAASNYLDTNALTDGLSHFYLVSDTNAPPVVYTISGANLSIGDTATLTGRGLTGVSVHDAGFNNITLSTDTATQVTFIVPAKGLISGPLAVERPNGGAFYTDIVNFNLHKVGVNGFTTPGHVTYDPNNGKVYYADINQPTSKIWQFDPSNGNISALGTVWPMRPYGLSVGS